MNLISKNSPYHWTAHAQHKMRFYQLSEGRVRRVIKSPSRVEEGIADDTVAVMQPSSYKTKNGVRDWSQEIWVMYAVDQKSKAPASPRAQRDEPASTHAKRGEESQKEGREKHTLTVISAWRYPGKTKPREKLPEEIMEHIRQALLK